MQTKFNYYTKELNEIVGILNNFPPIYDISLKELQKYKKLVSRKEFLQKKINCILNKRTKIIDKYNNKNRIWLASNMNCRKYYKLEQSAAYSRDSSLYKLGMLNSKPTPPFIQNFKNIFHEKISEPLSFKLSHIKNKINSYLKKVSEKSPIYQTVKKSKNYIRNDLPVSLTNVAVSSVKRCIVTYRKFTSTINGSVHLFTRTISSAPTIRTMASIINKAKIEADLQQNQFLARIKVDPNTNEYNNKIVAKNGYYGTGKVVSYPSIYKRSNLRVSKPVRKPSSSNSNLDLAL